MLFRNGFIGYMYRKFNPMSILHLIRVWQIMVLSIINKYLLYLITYFTYFILTVNYIHLPYQCVSPFINCIFIQFNYIQCMF